MHGEVDKKCPQDGGYNEGVVGFYWITRRQDHQRWETQGGGNGHEFGEFDLSSNENEPRQ